MHPGQRCIQEGEVSRPGFAAAAKRIINLAIKQVFLTRLIVAS